MMSKEVILEKPEHIVIYKIVEYNKQARRKDIIKLTKKIYKDLFERDVSDDAVINWIREITGFREDYNEQTGIQELKPAKDKRKKLEILKVRSGGFYEIANGIRVKPANKNIWDEVDRYLKIRRENRIISDELRIRHTDRIRERILRPWIEALDKHLSGFIKYKEYKKFIKNLKENPLYNDLKNHTPPNLNNPIELQDEIEKLENQLNQLEAKMRIKIKRALIKIFNEKNLEYTFSLNGTGFFVPSLILEIHNNIYNLDYFKNKLKDLIEIENNNIIINNKFYKSTVVVNKKYSKEEIIRIFSEILDDKKIKDIINDFNFNQCNEIFDKIIENKEKLLKILKELEAYEIIPGTCKYLTGGD